MRLIGSKVYVRFLETADAEAVLDLYTRNREFFQAYSPLHDEQFYTLKRQLEQIKISEDKREMDQQYLFGIFLKDAGQLIGSAKLAGVIRGPLQSCILGYSLDKEHNGKGYMTEAVRLIVHYAFNDLRLHRVEAGVMPHNIGSIRVLEKAGFHKEGIARKNVKINGRWEDHQILAIVNEDD